MDCFKAFAYEWDKFSELKTQYEGGKTKVRETQLGSKLVEIDASIEQIKLLLEEICSMSSKKTLNTYEMSQSFLKKANLITETIVALGALKKMIINHDFLTSLRRRLKQQNDVTNKSCVRSENELLNCFCENDTKLKWGVVQDNLIDFENSRFNLGTIEIDALLTTAGILSENVVTLMSKLPFNVTPEKVKKIVKLMPVIYLKNNQNSAFVNLHEFVFTPGIFESIFLINDDDGDETVLEEEQNEGSEPNEATSGRSRIGGRPSIVSKFTEIVDEVAEFIKQNGFAAQSRRRTEVGFSNSVTTREIQTHLYKTFPALKEHTISQTTIRRLFQAHNKHFRAAEHYTALINARVGTKSNIYREFPQDAQYFSREIKCDMSYHLYFLMIYQICLLTIWKRLKLVLQQ